MTHDPTTSPHDVPTAVFEQFIAELERTDVPAQVTAAIKKALLEDLTFTESALRAALSTHDKPV